MKIPFRFVALLTFLLAAMAVLLSHSDAAAESVRQGLLLCGRSVVPSLFPMFIAVTLAVDCGLSALLPPSIAALVLGLTGGYPMGAKTVAALYRRGDITAQQAQRMLCCCNNTGPAFILGVVGQGVFGSLRIGWALYAVHVLTALLFAAFFLRRTDTPCQGRSCVFFPTAFVGAVRTAAAAMLDLCGFVVLFLTAARLFTLFTAIDHPLVLGLLELTTATLSLPATKRGFVMAAALLSWGGVSVHAQTAAVLDGIPLRPAPYLLCKAAQALVAAAFAALAAAWFF